MIFQDVSIDRGETTRQLRAEPFEVSMTYGDIPLLIVASDDGTRTANMPRTEISPALYDTKQKFVPVLIIRGIPATETLQVAGCGKDSGGMLFFVFSSANASWVAPFYGNDEDVQSTFSEFWTNSLDPANLDAYQMGTLGPAHDVFYTPSSILHFGFNNSFFVLEQTSVQGDEDPQTTEAVAIDVREFMDGFDGFVGAVFLSVDMVCFFFVETYRLVVSTVEIDEDGAWEETKHVVMLDDFEDVFRVQTGRLGSTPFVRLLGTLFVYYAPFDDNGKLSGLIRFEWPENAELVMTHNNVRTQMAMFDRTNAYVASLVGSPTVYPSPGSHIDVLLPECRESFGRVIAET